MSPAFGNFTGEDKGYDADAAIIKFRAVKAGAAAESVAPISAVADQVWGVAQVGVTTAELARAKGVNVRREGITEWEAGGAIARGAKVTIDSVGRCVSVDAEVAATLLTGVVGSNNAIRWTSRRAGTGGNAVRITLTDPPGNNVALSVDVDGNDVNVTLATDGSSVITSTAQQVINAIEAHGDATALVDVGNETTSTGAGVVAAVAQTALATGAGTSSAKVYGTCDVATSVSGDRAAVSLSLPGYVNQP